MEVTRRAQDSKMYTHDLWQRKDKKSKYKMKEGDGKVTDIRHDDEVETLEFCLTGSCLSDNTLDVQ